MVRTLPTPTIAVNIGRQGRLYDAYVTTAPPAFDGPSTMTLYEAKLAEVVGLAADPIECSREQAGLAARLVLIDATELAWHRTRYRAGHHMLLAADPELVGLTSLQHWLWQRLQARPGVPGEADNGNRSTRGGLDHEHAANHA